MKSSRNNPYDIAAYYWPAYHDEPRWRRFMPAGEGEWETVRQARPKFPGHWQPRIPAWGCQDEADPKVMRQKIDAAVRHGVNIFIFDWYWYENQPFLEEALARGFLGARNSRQMQFYIMWANHDATTLWDLPHSHERRVIWPGAVDAPAFEAATQRLLDNFFRQPAYYKIDGQPVLSIYDVGTLIAGLGGIDNTRAALDGLRQRVRAAGFPDLHLQAILWRSVPTAPDPAGGGSVPTQNATLQQLGFDSLTHYQWAHYVRARGDYRAWSAAAMAAWPQVAREFSIPFFPHVSVGWDTNPRYRALQESIVTGGTPALFQACLGRALEFADQGGLTPRLVTVNSWNEWTEGSYLEPDTRHGTGYLEAVRAALAERGVIPPAAGL